MAKKGEKKPMSVVGHRLWVHMQNKGPYNKSAFAEMLTRTGIYPTKHQNLSNWLTKEYPPVPFINAVAVSLNLDQDEIDELRDLYFHGGQIPSQANREAADSIEGESIESGNGKPASQAS